MYKNGKWANEILKQQNDMGLWPNFHSLSMPKGDYFTTEQALRRLQILGYTIDDEVIYKSVIFMEKCINKKGIMLDRSEKSHNWELFSELMFATWIRRFTNNSKAANEIASKWATIISDAFAKGSFSIDQYKQTYKKIFKENLYGPRFIDFSNFYHISLLNNLLEDSIEILFIKAIMNKGIYYIHQKSLYNLPSSFHSKDTTRFLASVELLSHYKTALPMLDYVVKWLLDNEINTEKWDLGSSSKDYIYMPLSDSWRDVNNRILDSTYWIGRIKSKLIL